MVVLREIAENSQQSNECLNEQKLLMICIDSYENYLFEKIFLLELR